MTTITKQLADALRTIMEQRDHHAEHGSYRPGTMGEDQCFDDWAADIAETVLAAYDAQQGATPGNDVRWHVEKGVEVWRDDTVAEDGRSGGSAIAPLAVCEYEEDAAHIVQCVNAHDTLVSALRTILADKGSASFNDDLEAYDAAIQTARDALSQVGVTP